MTSLAWLAALAAVAIVAGSIWLIRDHARPSAPLLTSPPPPGTPPILYQQTPVFAYVPNARPASSHRPGEGRAHFTGFECPATHAALARRQQAPGSAHNAPRVFRFARHA